MTAFNKLAGASTLRKDAPPDGAGLLNEAVARIAVCLAEMTGRNALEKAASVERIHAAGDEIRRDLDSIAALVDGLGRELTKRDAQARKQAFAGRPLASLNPDDPAALEFVAEAIRQNPRLLDKLN